MVVFLDSCVHHCGYWNSIVIDNKDSGQAFRDWYNGQNGQNFQGKTYPCNPCCNRGGFNDTTIEMQHRSKIFFKVRNK